METCPNSQNYAVVRPSIPVEGGPPPLLHVPSQQLLQTPKLAHTHRESKSVGHPEPSATSSVADCDKVGPVRGERGSVVNRQPYDSSLSGQQDGMLADHERIQFRRDNESRFLVYRDDAQCRCYGHRSPNECRTTIHDNAHYAQTSHPGHPGASGIGHHTQHPLLHTNVNQAGDSEQSFAEAKGHGRGQFYPYFSRCDSDTLVRWSRKVGWQVMSSL